MVVVAMVATIIPQKTPPQVAQPLRSIRVSLGLLSLTIQARLSLAAVAEAAAVMMVEAAAVLAAARAVKAKPLHQTHW